MSTCGSKVAVGAKCLGASGQPQHAAARKGSAQKLQPAAKCMFEKGKRMDLKNTSRRSYARSHTVEVKAAVERSASTPLINLEGGRQMTWVKCECSKCQGLVMCGDRELLPSSVLPVHYDLLLQPDLEKFTYTGSMSVELVVQEPCNAITFHARDLAIQTGVVIDASGAERTNPGGLDILYGEEAQETATVALAKPFTKADVGSKVTLKLSFTGVLNDKLAGFYRSAYKAPDGSGETRHMAVTQFEPTDARRCFPCWDEPALKATFKMALRVPQDRVALSNMPEESTEEIDDGTKTVSFATTPIMSTYLLAFVVGEFDFVEDKTKEGVTVRCYTEVGQQEKGRFALDTACRVLSFFGEYFDSPYPLPKMDMIAIPDFSAGAMENWGLVTYRSSLMLYEEGKTPINAKQSIGYVVGHELAHQWFGNLVTMEWWSQLWLNEGFATWVGWRAMDELFPEWKVWSQFVANEQAMGLGLDSLKSSHPVEVPIASAGQVSEIFDAISYSKGSCVIRMLEAYLGEDTFRTGMRAYVKQHAYANAGTTDLWAALSGASGKDVAALMGCWTQQMGYPVVSVALNDASDEVTVTQRRYLASGPAGVDPSDTSLWRVPLRAAGLPDVLTEPSAVFPLAVGAAQNLKLNSGQSGFYRTVYDDKARTALVALLPSLPEVDRVGVVSDAFATGAAGYASTTDALDLLTACRDDPSYVVWAEISGGLGSLVSAMFEQGDETVEALRAFGCEIYGPQAERLGWEKKEGAEESHTDALLRQLVVSRCLAFEEPLALAEAKRRFQAYTAGDTAALPADLKGAVLAAVMRTGGAAEMEQLQAMYAKAESAVEESQLLGAMGAAPTKELVLKALEFNLTDKVRMQNGGSIIGSCAGNQAGRRATWEWVQANWDRLEERFGGGGVSSILTRIAGGSCGGLASEADAKAAEVFFGSKTTPGIERTVTQSVEAIRARSDRVKRDADKVAAWLKARA